MRSRVKDALKFLGLQQASSKERKGLFFGAIDKVATTTAV